MIQGATIRRPITTRAAIETATIPVSLIHAGIASARDLAAVTALTSNPLVTQVASRPRSSLASQAGSREPRFPREPGELGGVVEADARCALGDPQQHSVLDDLAARGLLERRSVG